MANIVDISNTFVGATAGKPMQCNGQSLLATDCLSHSCILVLNFVSIHMIQLIESIHRESKFGGKILLLHVFFLESTIHAQHSPNIHHRLHLASSTYVLVSAVWSQPPGEKGSANSTENQILEMNKIEKEGRLLGHWPPTFYRKSP